MASGKGWTPAAQAPNLEDKGKKSHGRQMNRIAAWPAEKGGHQHWETKLKKSPGRQMNRNAAWPAQKGRTPAAEAPNLGDKSEEIA